MMTATHTMIDQTADRMARYFAARVSHADYEDCYQEAWLALLGAVGSYDASRGAWGPWAARVAARHIRAHLYAQRAPVTGSRSRARRTLAGIGRASLEKIAHADPKPTADEALSARRASAAVIRAVTEVTAKMEPKRQAASRAVLLGGLKPREAAALNGLSADVVGWAVRRARGEIKRHYARSLRPHL